MHEQKIILLVEDELLIAMAESETIRRFGYETLTVNSGEKAVETATNGKEIDLILMDIDLGKGLTGPEAAKLILEKKNIPIVFLTSHSEREMVEKVRGITRYGYVIKNSGDFVLQSSIEMAFELYESNRILENHLEKLRESEEKYHFVADNTYVWEFWLTPDGNYKYVSPSCEKMTGYSAQEFISDPHLLERIVHPDDQKMVSSHLSEAISNKSFAHKFEFRLLTRNGEIRWLEHYCFSVFNDNGVFLGKRGSNQDITQRKQAEEALRESEFFFRESQRAGFIGSYKTDFIKGIWESSEIMDAIFGIDKNYIRSIPGWLEIVHPDDREMMAEYLSEEVIGKRKPFDKEYRILRKSDGETRWVNGSGKVDFDANGNIISLIGTIQDITDRKKTEMMLQNTHKFETLGFLAGGIAHDLNNLMAGIFGYIDLAKENSNEEKVRQYISKAMGSIERVRNLTGQLLTFGKDNSQVLKTDKLFPLVKEIVKFALSGSNVSPIFDIDENLWSCHFDKNQIGQVIDNIVINARQSMQEGGVVELTARNLSLSEKEHSTSDKCNYVKISIKDTGVGIPKEIINHIFEPFFTTKTNGYGLGLATCYSIITRHGGFIEVESEINEGSTFHIYLPAQSESVSMLSTQQEKLTHQGIGTILLMDDEEVILDTIGEMLRALGYCVICSKTGEEVCNILIEEIRSNRKISGIILDMTIPGGMGGKETIAEIRKLDKDIPVFVSSGYSEHAVMTNPTEYGFTASICKPFTISDLSAMINKNQNIQTK